MRGALAWTVSSTGGAARVAHPRFSFAWWMDIRLSDVTYRSPQKNLLACCCYCVVPIIIILLFLPYSITQLGQHKIALAKNRWSGRVGLDRVYTPGRYWIGFWRNFLEFPLTLETIDFSDEVPEADVDDLHALRCRDMDGKQIWLDVSLQYQLIPERLADIYRDTKLLYEDLIIADMRAEFLMAANSFRARDIWENYTKVHNIFLERCKAVMLRRHVICWGLQVWGSRLHKKYEAKVVATQVSKQRYKKNEVAMQSARIRQATKIMVAEMKKRKTIIEARGTAAVYTNLQQAKATALRRLISMEAFIIDQVNGTFLNLSAPSVNIGLNGSQMTVYQWRILLEKAVAGKSTIAYSQLPNHLGPATPPPPLPKSFSARSYAGKKQTALMGQQGRRLAEPDGDPEPSPRKPKLRLQQRRAAAAAPLRAPPAAAAAGARERRAQDKIASESLLLDMDALHTEEALAEHLPTLRRLLSARPLHGPPVDDSLAAAPPRTMSSSPTSATAGGVHEL